MKSNHLPNHAASSGGVNAVGVEVKKERVLKVSMERLYGMWYSLDIYMSLNQ